MPAKLLPPPSPAEAADNDVGFCVGHLHLRDGLLPDDGLVEQHVVQDAAQAVARIFGAAERHLNGLRNGEPEASRAVGIAGEGGASRLGDRRGRSHTLGPPGVHHQTAIGFLVVADADHEDLEVDSEVLRSEGDRGAPLSGSGFGGQVFDALFVVVVGLRHGGIGLVGSDRRDAFVLEVDLRGGVEGLFEPRGTHQRSRTPYFVDLLHLFGNIDEAFGGHLLVDEFLGEDRRHLLLGDGLFGLGMQWREGFRGHIGHDVVPLCRHLVFGEAEFLRVHGVWKFELFDFWRFEQEKSPLLTVRKQRAFVYSIRLYHTRDGSHSLFTRVNGRHHQACMLKFRSMFPNCFLQI